MAFTLPWQLMGLQVSGDFADLTIYTDRYGKKVPFLKSPPKEPASPLQLAQRAAFKAAQASYMALTTQQKFNLEQACQKTSTGITGQNLWIHAKLKLDDPAYATVAAQSGITLPPL